MGKVGKILLQKKVFKLQILSQNLGNGMILNYEYHRNLPFPRFETL